MPGVTRRGFTRLSLREKKKILIQITGNSLLLRGSLWWWRFARCAVWRKRAQGTRAASTRSHLATRGQESPSQGWAPEGGTAAEGQTGLQEPPDWTGELGSQTWDPSFLSWGHPELLLSILAQLPQRGAGPSPENGEGTPFGLGSRLMPCVSCGATPVKAGALISFGPGASSIPTGLRSSRAGHLDPQVLERERHGKNSEPWSL